MLSGIAFDGEGPDGHPETGTVFRIESSTQAVPLAAPEAPDVLTLATRPNPSRTRAVVEYQLARAAPVRLTVMDALGREIDVLVDEDQSEGSHRAGLDTSQLASGVYVVVLSAGEAQATRTITVVR